MTGQKAAHRIAEIAWRERNPQGGNFTPESDAGQHDLVQAAEIFIGLPASPIVAVNALVEISKVRGQQGSEARRMAESALLVLGVVKGEDLPEALREGRMG